MQRTLNLDREVNLFFSPSARADIDDVTPPFVPAVKDPTDTSNFDTIEPEPETLASPKVSAKCI